MSAPASILPVQDEARNVMHSLLGLLQIPLESALQINFTGEPEQPIPTPLKVTAFMAGVFGAIGVSKTPTRSTFNYCKPK